MPSAATLKSQDSAKLTTTAVDVTVDDAKGRDGEISQPIGDTLKLIPVQFTRPDLLQVSPRAECRPFSGTDH